MEKLINSDKDTQNIFKLGASFFPQRVNSYFGKNEIPKELTRWREIVDDNQNPGLALRWVAALAEIGDNKNISNDEIRSAKIHWRSEVLKMISKEPHLKYFDKFSQPVEADTIICFEIHSLFKKGCSMKKDELDYVYKAMRMDLTDVVNWDKSPELEDYPDPVPSHYYHYDYEKV